MSAPTVTSPRVFLRCGACQRNAVFVVGRAGREVYECFSCGRRRAMHAEHRRVRVPSRFPW